MGGEADWSPGSGLFDLCSMFQAGALGQGPGPKFGRKPTQNRPKQICYFSVLIYVLVSKVGVSQGVSTGASQGPAGRGGGRVRPPAVSPRELHCSINSFRFRRSGGSERGREGRNLQFSSRRPPNPHSHNSAGPVLLRTSERTYSAAGLEIGLPGRISAGF